MCSHCDVTSLGRVLSLTLPLCVTQAERIKRNGARIIGIGITDAFSEAEIKSLVTDPNGDFFAISSFEQLNTRLTDILNSVRLIALLP